MKFFAVTFLIALLSLLSGLYMPWWAFAFAAALVTVLIPLRPGWAFVAGFIALFLLWGAMAFAQDNANAGILSSKVASILPLGGSSMLLILVTALIGALIGGAAALTGSLLKKMTIPAE